MLEEHGLIATSTLGFVPLHIPTSVKDEEKIELISRDLAIKTGGKNLGCIPLGIVWVIVVRSIEGEQLLREDKTEGLIASMLYSLQIEFKNPHCKMGLEDFTLSVIGFN